MKDLRTITRAKFSMPQNDSNRPVRAVLQASYDGEFWYRVAGHPALPKAPAVRDDYGPMQFRIYSGNSANVSSWQQVQSLATAEPVDSGTVEDGSLHWERIQDEGVKPQYAAVLWYGKFVQPRPGAVRLTVQGYRTALAIDGRLELDVAQKNQSVDVWLDQGNP